MATVMKMKKHTVLDMMNQWIWIMVHHIMVVEDHQITFILALLLIILPEDLTEGVHMEDHQDLGREMHIHHQVIMNQ